MRYTEKHRPRSFEDIVGQDVADIERLVNGRDTPNFLFYGPPGTGKTTTAYAIATAIQGSLNELMEFNASDDRGIDVVREEVIPAVSQTTLTGKPRVIYLDEMDSMTEEAQQALRQPMERGEGIFLLSCNDITSVHPAIQSRCRDFEFSYLAAHDIRDYLETVAHRERLDVPTDRLEQIAQNAGGDMRQALYRLQSEASDEPSSGQTPNEYAERYGLTSQ